MSLKVTQEHFNETVLDNMECFDLTLEESIKDTIAQFKAQGADLFGIITDPEVITGINPIKTIKDQLETEPNFEKKIALFKELTELVKKEMAYKVYCGKSGVYDLCFQVLNDPDNDDSLKHVTMDFLLILFEGYPDLLDERGVRFFVDLLEKDYSSQKYGLKLIRVTCIKHENNRQRYMDANISQKLATIATQTQNDYLLILVAKVISSLTLDDDIRAEIPKFYTNAIGLADYLLKPLCYLLKVKKDPTTLGYILKALTSVVVNYNYCTEVEAEGGLAAVMNILEKSRHIENKSARERLVNNCFKFLTSLAVNDVVKDKLMKYDVAQVIRSSMIEFSSSKDHINKALLLISKISLRSPEYGKLFFKLDFPELIVQAMNTFVDDYSIQASGCWCIRNMASRNPEYHTQFLQLGVEEVLNRIGKLNECCSYDAKIALQQLGCAVVAREPWTGKEGDKLARD